MYLVKCYPYRFGFGNQSVRFQAAGKDYVFSLLIAPGDLMLEYGVSSISSCWFREHSVLPSYFRWLCAGVFLLPESVSIV